MQPTERPDSPAAPSRSRSQFQRFFVRGLAIVLPTVLTFWLLTVAWQFLDARIGQPINAGLRETVIRFTEWPVARDADFLTAFDELPAPRREDFAAVGERRAATLGLRRFDDLPLATQRLEKLHWMADQPDAVILARRNAFEQWWNQLGILGWPVLDVIGIVLAIIIVYFIGAFLSRSIGHRLWRIGEGMISRVPLVGRVYPAFKQITDFVFGDDRDDKLKFNRVVAVQYPRKGLWSVGLVTGNTMRTIQDQAGRPCLTVFVPSSPTPFTGYVITVPIEDTVDLPVTIEDALKFAVSGGVVVPMNQTIPGEPVRAVRDGSAVTLHPAHAHDDADDDADDRRASA
jgi:uncharacterized membrane protein